MAVKRQLAAIMYTDIAGFSSIMYTDPALADQIRTRHLAIFKGAHEKYNGQLIQQFGDSTLSIFDSAAEAIECAYFIQLELRQAPEIPVRIGIHTGEILQDQRGAYGDGLKIASRVERLAEPGSILMTAKVYDDIKNHSWISAHSLGKFSMEDLVGDFELYTVNNKGLFVPRARRAANMRPPSADQEIVNQELRSGSGKNKKTAGFLALFMTAFGAHRFYLDQRFKGFLYVLASFVLFMISIEEHAPFILIMFLIGLVEAVLFFVMPLADFDERYNSGVRQVSNHKPKKSSKTNRVARFRLMKAGVSKFESQNYEESIQLLDKVLQQDQHNPAAHFYLACCFSMLQDIEDGFFHLGRAIEEGFDDFARIEKDRALKYLRQDNRYHSFRESYMGFPPALQSPSPNLFEEKLDLSVFEKIEVLGEKLAKGELSSEEFEKEKTKILNH